MARWIGLEILIPKHPWKSKIGLLQPILAAKRYVTFFWVTLYIYKVFTKGKIQKKKKTITGHDLWLECPTDLRSTPLSYIFNALFTDTPLGYLSSCPVFHVCHFTYVTCQLSHKEGKWGIHGKSLKNVAKRCWPQIRKTLQSKVMARNWSFGNSPLYIPL